MADDALLVDGGEHALEGCFDSIDRLVDDLVEADVDPFLVCHGLGQHIRADIEADDHGIGSGSEGNIGLCDIADRRVDDLDDDLLVGELEQALTQCFYGALHIRLEDEVEFLERPFLHLCEQVVQVHAHPCLFDELLLTLDLVGLGIGFGCLQIIVGKEYFSRAGDVGQTEDLDRMGRSGLFDPSALVIDHGPDLAGACARGNKVADMQRALLDQDIGHRAAALVEHGFQNKASCLSVGICLELHDIRSQKDRLQQVFDPVSGLCGDFDELRGAAPFRGDQLIFSELLLDTLGICAVLIDLVDSDHDLDTGCFRVVDSFNRLRHDTVIGRDDQNGDIGGIGAAHTHGCESLMTGCIKEGDIPSVDGDHVSADGLRDAAGLLAGDACAADGIQKGGLAVVDMAHDTDDGRTGNHLGLVLFLFAEQLFDHVDLLLFLAQDIVAKRDLLSLIITDFAVGCHGLALQEEFLDDLGSLQMHSLSQFTDGDLLGNKDSLDLLFRGSLILLLRTDKASALVSAALLVLVIDLILSGSAVFLLIILAASLV